MDGRMDPRKGGWMDEWMALRKEGLTNGWGLGFGN